MKTNWIKEYRTLLEKLLELKARYIEMWGHAKTKPEEKMIEEELARVQPLLDKLILYFHDRLDFKEERER